MEKMEYRFADRINNLKPSAIREILKNNDPNIIPLAAGNPAVESFPIAEIASVTLSTIFLRRTVRSANARMKGAAA